MPLREDEIREVHAIVREEIAKAIAAIPKIVKKTPVSIKNPVKKEFLGGTENARSI